MGETEVYIVFYNNQAILLEYRGLSTICFTYPSSIKRTSRRGVSQNMSPTTGPLYLYIEMRETPP